MSDRVRFVEPGEEFLQIRLQRAQAVPPAQRTPEVAAFVEAMQLDEEACTLLPLVMVPGATTASPVLPATEATAQRVLLAVIKLYRMDYICGDFLKPAHKLLHHIRW